MHLVVHIPDRADEESASALMLARLAPSFTTEWVHDEKVGVAIYSSSPSRIDAALRLVGEAVRLKGAWASIDGKPLSSLTKLWQRLACYHESLQAKDALPFCREQSTLFNTLVGCEAHRCPVPCQFICRPCMRMEQASGAIATADQLALAAESAEVDWCPQLRLVLQKPADLIVSPSSKT
jgi:hypothetical protein